jgi:hypothetical protein
MTMLYVMICYIKIDEQMKDRLGDQREGGVNGSQ